MGELAAWPPARASATVAAACRGRRHPHKAYYRASSAGWAACYPSSEQAPHLTGALAVRLSLHGRELALGLRAPMVCEAKLALLTLRVQLISLSGELKCPDEK